MMRGWAQDSLALLLNAIVADDSEALELNRSLLRAGLAKDENVAQAETGYESARAQALNTGVLRAQ